MQENLVWITIIGIVCAIVCVLIYIYIRDVETTKYFKQYEKSIDELTRQNYQKDKKIKILEERLEALEKGQGGSAAINHLSHNLKEEIQTTLNHAISNVYAEVNKLAEDVRGERETLDDRIVMLEEKIKEVGYFPTNPNGVDESRIISMFKDGYSVDAIAKELRIGKGEVVFTLKLSNL